ncbi:MAG: phospholipase D family protein [Acidimicrobiia bacterium]
MLAPDDRSVLLELLRPPGGMGLDVGVATTFTLNLEAALVAPLAFASFPTGGPGDPISTLEAVRSVADRLTVFCQAGAIGVPNTANDLFTFLEPMVYEVRRPPGFLFHPKLWLLRFASDDRVALRLLVPTRNLTNDSGWDAVLALDAEAGTRIDTANRPLVDLVEWCLRATTRAVPEPRRKKIGSMLEDFRRATWDYPEGVNQMEFHTLGVGRRTQVDFSGRRTLVISPFVSDQGLAIVAPTDDVMLVSRPAEMEKLDRDVVQDLTDTLWIASVDTEEEPAPDTPPPLGELHAKVMVVERGKQAIMFVGSTNATGPAFGGNVEVLVELRGGVKNLGIDKVATDMKSILEACEIRGGQERAEKDELQHAVDNVLRDAAERAWLVTVAPAPAGKYQLLVATPEPVVEAEFTGRATIELLTLPGVARPVVPGEQVHAEFIDVNLTDITPFVVLHVELSGPTTTVTGSAVVRAEIEGDPADRLDAVLARQFDTPDKFLRFLFLLLGLQGGQIPPWLQPGPDGHTSAGGVAVHRLVELGVFEAMLRALATNQSALDDLGRLVERLRATPEGKLRLPDGFEELWTAVAAARTKLADVPA